MRLNWGTGIALVYGVFMFGILSAVFASRRHNPRLVQQDYYALDLNYQERLDRKQNSAALAQDVRVQFDPASQQLKVNFPVEAGTPSGTIKLYPIGGGSADLAIPVQADAQGAMSIAAENMLAGRWHVEMEWEAGGQKFYHESALTIFHH